MDDKYAERLFDYLDNLNPGIYKVSSLCKPENLDRFICLVNQYISFNEYGNGIVFIDYSCDYIKKIDISNKQNFK